MTRLAMFKLRRAAKIRVVTMRSASAKLRALVENPLQRSILCATMLAVACGSETSPTAPQSPCRTCPPVDMRAPNCAAFGTELRCSASAWVERLHTEIPVTDQADWWVSQEPFCSGRSITAIAEITSPGVVVPRQRGAVYICAAYSDGAYRDSAPAAHSYLVDPANGPIALAPYVTGDIRGTGTITIDGAIVEIIDGPDAGRRDVSRVNGFYFLNHVHMSVPFRVRVSKAGYETVEKPHEAIIDNELGYPLSPPLTFILTATR
jgi:hypothetical protein